MFLVPTPTGIFPAAYFVGANWPPGPVQTEDTSIAKNHPIYRSSYIVKTRDIVPLCADVQFCLNHRSRQIILSDNGNKRWAR